MKRRTRWIIATVLPVVLAAAGVGGWLGYDAYQHRCAATFPPDTPSRFEVPTWHPAAEADRLHPTDADRRDRSLTAQRLAVLGQRRAAAAAGARAAAGIGPFGTWVAAAYDTTTGATSGASTPNLGGFVDGNLVLTNRLGNSTDILAVVDPLTGRRRWARQGWGGAYARLPGGKTVAQITVDKRGDQGLVRAAAIGTGGDLAWCATIAATERANSEIWSVTSADGELTILHNTPVDEDGESPRGTTVTRLDDATGRRLWSRTFPPIDYPGEEHLVRSVLSAGDRLLLSQLERLDPALSDGQAAAHAGTDYPVIALDSATGRERWRYTPAPTAGGGHWAQHVVAATAEITVVVGAVPGSATSAERTRCRLTGIDGTGAERWRVDDANWSPGQLSGYPAFLVADDLLVTLGTGADGQRLVAYRMADGAVAWTAPWHASAQALRGAAQVGSYLVLPALDGISVFDGRDGRLAGTIGVTDAMALALAEVRADDRTIVLSGPSGIYVWERAT